MAEKNIIEVTDSNFDKEVIEKSKKIPVVVDFWASWCFPCKIIGPTLEKLAEKNKGKIILAKINVDVSPKKAREYGIMSIPSVKMFKGGKVADEFMGAIPEKQAASWLEKNL